MESDSALLVELWIDSVLCLMRSSIGSFNVSVATDPSLNLKLTKLSVDEVYAIDPFIKLPCARYS